MWYGIRPYRIYRNSSNLRCGPCSRQAADPELSALLPAPLLFHAQRGEGLEQTLRHSSTNYCCPALWPWCPVKKKKSSYDHSGLCAPGPVSVVFFLWITATWVHIVTHSNFSESAVRAGGASSSRWSHVKDSDSAASQNWQTKLTAQVRKRAQLVLIWYVTDLCGRI